MTTVTALLTSIVGAYVLLCIILGFVDLKQIRNLKEFAIGNRMSTAVLVATIYATHMGAGSTIGLIEGVNNIGIVCVLAALASPFSWYITRFIYSKNLDRFKECMSHAQVMEVLYGRFGFILSNVVTIIDSVATVAMQVMAMGFLIQYFFGCPQSISVVISTLIVTIYSVSGGIKAVILTDIVQFALFGIMILIVFIITTNSLDSNGDFWSSIPKNKSWIIPYDINSFLTTAGILAYAFIPIGHGAAFMQRILISGSSSQMSKVFLYTMYIDFVVMSAISIIGIFLLPITGEGIISKLDIFRMIHNNGSAFIVVGIVIGIMAVTMSTADSWLNSGSIVLTQSIIKLVKPNMSDFAQVNTARLITVLLGVIAGTVALIGGDILSLLLTSLSFVVPLSVIPTAAGFLGYNLTPNDCKRSIIFAILSVLIGRVIGGEFGFVSLLFGMMGGIIGMAIPYKWTFKLPDGSSILRMPKLNISNTSFLVFVIILWATATLLHMYIDNEWLYADVITFCICPLSCIYTLCIQLYYQEKNFLHRTYIGSLTLIAAITIFALKSNHVNVAVNFYFLIVVLVMFAYQLKYIVLHGITLGVTMFYTFPNVFMYSNRIPNNLTIIMLLLLAMALYLIMYNELTITNLKAAAITDPMTGFYNISYDYEELFGRYADISAIAIDIDKFKRFNDEYKSHDVGDSVLKAVADVIKECVRKEDVCIRRGGDEFVIIIPDAGIEKATSIAERIASSLENTVIPINQPPYKTSCTISYGVDTLKPQDKKLWDVVKRADEFIYIGKDLKSKLCTKNLGPINDADAI